MKKLIMLGMLVSTVAFAGTAFADGHDHALKEMQLQELFAWSAQAASAQPGKPAASVPAYQQYPGYQNVPLH